MAGRPAPLKPWERNKGAAGGSTAPCCSSGTPGADNLPKPWERPQGGAETITPVTSTPTTAAAGAAVPGNSMTVGPAGSRPNAARPWERPGGTAVPSSTAYGSGAYGSTYGSTPYSSTGYGGGYGNSMYNSSPYNRPYGSSSYGGYGSGGYGSSMYGSSYGGGYGGYGSSMYGGGMYAGGGGMYGGGGMFGRPMGMQGPFDPNDPNGPPQPPSAWQAMLHSVQGVMHFFGRLSFLVDENAHAVHFFVTALLQLLDRFGSLYGELARFILRLLGFKTGKRKLAAGKGGSQEGGAPGELAGPVGPPGMLPPAGGGPMALPGPAGAPGGDNWNSLW